MAAGSSETSINIYHTTGRQWISLSDQVLSVPEYIFTHFLEVVHESNKP
jgi:hypothetical protein